LSTKEKLYNHDKQHYLLPFLDNFWRSGDLANFSVDEFGKAEHVDGDYVCTIRRHKTDGKYAAPLVMKAEVWKAVNTFIQRVRPTLRNAKNEEVFFLTSSGKPTTSSEIKGAWQSYGQDLGRNPGDITAMMVRRYAVTITRQAAASHDEQYQLSSAMCHQLQTAIHIYDRSGQLQRGQASAGESSFKQST
jgi:hypothetical protein